MLAYKLEDIQLSANVGTDEKCAVVKKQIEEIRKLLEARDERAFHRICVMIYRYPELPYGHNLLGLLYEREGRTREAIRQYRAALALAPNFMSADRNLQRLTVCGAEGSFDLDYGDHDFAFEQIAPNKNHFIRWFHN